MSMSSVWMNTASHFIITNSLFRFESAIADFNLCIYIYVCLSCNILIGATLNESHTSVFGGTVSFVRPFAHTAYARMLQISACSTLVHIQVLFYNSTNSKKEANSKDRRDNSLLDMALMSNRQ